VSGGEDHRLQNRARLLRQSFDRAFAAPLMTGVDGRTDFLAVRVSGDPYALRLAELAGLSADKKIVATPSRAPAMLGLAGFRGAVTPVFDLGRLLGYPPAGTLRWIALAGERVQIGLAFDAFEAHLRVASGALFAETTTERPGLRGAVRDGELTRPILHFPTLLSLIEGRAPEAGASEER
jgi:purine-binding chemotaxis protein CheW